MPNISRFLRVYVFTAEKFTSVALLTRTKLNKADTKPTCLTVRSPAAHGANLEASAAPSVFQACLRSGGLAHITILEISQEPHHILGAGRHCPTGKAMISTTRTPTRPSVANPAVVRHTRQDHLSTDLYYSTTGIVFATRCRSKRRANTLELLCLSLATTCSRDTRKGSQLGQERKKNRSVANTIILAPLLDLLTWDLGSTVDSLTDQATTTKMAISMNIASRVQLQVLHSTHIATPPTRVPRLTTSINAAPPPIARRMKAAADAKVGPSTTVSSPPLRIRRLIRLPLAGMMTLGPGNPTYM
jgi:hypothetical protein